MPFMGFPCFSTRCLPLTRCITFPAGTPRAKETQKFRLCHRHPVDLPLETALSLESKFLMQRHEVIAARQQVELRRVARQGKERSAAPAVILP